MRAYGRKNYPDPESRILDAVTKSAPMRQVIRAVKASYGAGPPDKTTIWRAIKRLQAEGLVDAQAKKVAKEYTVSALSPQTLPH
ncbi:MAG: hypothetical protein QXJ75_06560 [Candidatus Bathyarchaeia archaeon]